MPEGRYAVGTLVDTVQCNQGFTITGASPFGSSHTCEEPGVWVPPPVECVPNNRGKYSYNNVLHTAHPVIGVSRVYIKTSAVECIPNNYGKYNTRRPNDHRESRAYIKNNSCIMYTQ